MSDPSPIPQPAFLVAQIDSHPEILSNYWLLGLAWLLQGEEAEAQAAWFSAALTIAPETVEAGIPELLQLLRTEAVRQGAIGQFQTAERIYQQLWELEPIAADALELGSVISQQGRYEEAIALWERVIRQSAIELQPGCEPINQSAYVKQAGVWQKLGQLEEAIAAYRQAIEIQSSWQPQYQLGLCLAARGNWDEAIAAYRQALQQSDRQEIHGDLGWALLQIGEREAAIAQFQQANFELRETTRLSMQTDETAKADQTLSSACLPIGCYETAQAWAEAEPLGDYMPLDAAERVELRSPKTLDAEIHFSFRFGAAIDDFG
jgi:tetratricopeptide (TPR) repeat protein